MTTTISQPSKDVLEAEVPLEILEQFKILNETIEKNNILAQEFLLNTSPDELQKLDIEITKITRLFRELRSAVRKERMKNHALSEHVARDGQMAEQVNRRYEVLTKNPQFGRSQAVEYMHTIASEHERNLIESEAVITKVEETLRSLMDTDKESDILTQRDLSEHIQRFDEIFSVVASQVCGVNEEVERLKDAFLEYQTKIYGRYARNPFEKRKERQKMVDAFSNLKGLDAFPSQNAVLSISEFLPKQQQPAAATTGGLFGTGGNSNIGGASGGLFFNNKTAVSTAGSSFSLFNQSQNQFAKPVASGAPTGFTNTTPSLFGPSAAPSIFGPASTAASVSSGLMFNSATFTASKPLFGAAATAATAPLGFAGFANPAVSSAGNAFSFGATTTPAVTTNTSVFGNSLIAGSTNFGNTLNSPSSGTLFSGSAPSAAKSLFGAK